MLKRLLEFEIQDIKIERLIDDSTALCEIRVITEGQNKHGLPLSIETIMDAAERSLRGKPILATYSDWKRDLEGHKRPEDSEPIGYFIENQEFLYKTVENGKKALFAKGLLWKRYATKQVIAIFEGENHSKEVSMEISIRSLVDEEDKNKGIASFDFLGLVVLGGDYSPASPNSKATLLTFSEMKDKYEALLFEDKNSMKINNTKGSAINSSSWQNPGRKLYSRIMEKSNSKSLLSEAYLVVESGYRDRPSESLKYPHHSIKNNELVVNVAGVQSALKRAEQQHIATGEILAHLKKHYKELGLSTESFATNFEEKEENTLEDKVMMAEPEVKEEEKFVEPVTEQPEKEETSEPVETPEEEKKEEAEEDYCMKYAEASKQLEEFTVKFAEQEKEVESLRKYKEDREKQDKTFAIEQTFAEVSDFLPKEEIDKFRIEADSIQFSEVEAFKNKVKARSLDFAKDATSTSATRMAIVRENETPKDKWGW
jgi:hypothetical protein